MDRQTLRDAVVRYNAKGLEGLHDRPKGYSPRRLTADEEAALAAVIIAGPEPERDGVCAWIRADLCRWLEEHFAKIYHPSSMDPGSTADGIFPPEARARATREGTPKRRSASKKGASRHPEGRPPRRHPDKRLQRWFQDEAIASATRAGCVTDGGAGASVPPGRVKSATSGPTSSPPLRPDTGDDVTLVMPSVNAKVMDLFLAHFADTLDQDAHAVMMCDGAGWHDERALTVPDMTSRLALLPPYGPELNPEIERVPGSTYANASYRSASSTRTEAIIDACLAKHRIDVIAEPDRMRTLCHHYPWIMKVIS